MIVAERKPFDEIKEMVAPYDRILVVGCGTCVAVCSTGGEKEVAVLASELRMASKMEGKERRIDEVTVQRQCEREFIDPLEKSMDGGIAVVSMACGAGVQLLSERFPMIPVLPGVNTTFIGANTEPGVWTEYCRGCGDCVLDETAGICPITRCSKNLINGACGGTDKGMCEVDPKSMDCGWFLIYKRLKERNRLDLLKKMREPRDWSRDRGKGRRRLSREELMEAKVEETAG